MNNDFQKLFDAYKTLIYNHTFCENINEVLKTPINEIINFVEVELPNIITNDLKLSKKYHLNYNLQDVLNVYKAIINDKYLYSYIIEKNIKNNIEDFVKNVEVKLPNMIMYDLKLLNEICDVM
jgi:hypothetical protein